MLFCCCLVTKLCPSVFITLCTVVHLTSLSMGFPRQEHWIGLPFPSLGNLPDPGIKPASLTFIGGFFTTEPPGSPQNCIPPPLESLERIGFEATCEEHSGLVVHCLNHLDISPTLSTRKCSFYTHTHTHTHMKINHSFSKCINTYFVCFFYFHSPTFIYTSRFSCTIPQNLWGHVFKRLEILSIFFKKKFSLCRSLISFLFFHFSHGISGIQVASFVYNQ